MKQTIILTLFILCSCAFAYAQKQGDTLYISQNGTKFKVGQKITLGLGSGTDGRYKYITAMDIFGNPDRNGPLAPEYATHQVVIKKIRSVKAGVYASSPTVFLVFKPDGDLHGFGINIEPALLAKEVSAN